MTIEETRRRNEASMRRKQATTTNAALTADPTAGPPSPASTGAMDTLLEKLRAAAPQARDQRDRRRRARLKDKHQVRIASGQKMPEVLDSKATDEGAAETGLLSPTSETSESATAESREAGGSGAVQPLSDGEDVAERAASLLLGLRGDISAPPDAESVNRDDSLRVRRRRESADDERAARRRRRRQAGGSTADLGSGMPTPPTISEEAEGAGATGDEPANDEAAREKKADGVEAEAPTPVTIVSPPSPAVSEKVGFVTPPG